MKFCTTILLVLTVASVAACGDDGHKKAKKSAATIEQGPVTAPTYAVLTVSLADQTLWKQGAQMNFHLVCTEVESKNVFPDETYQGMITNVPFALLPSHCRIDTAGLKIGGLSYNLADPFELDLKAGDKTNIYMVVTEGTLSLITNFTLSSADPDGDCIIGAADPFPLVPDPNSPLSCR